MSTTMFIAQLLFPLFALMTLSLLINPKRYKQIMKELSSNPPLIHIASVMHIVGGTAIILYHNIRTQDWSIVITIIGWLIAIKGAIHMLFPHTVGIMAKTMSNKSTLYVAAIVCIVISVILFSLTGLR